MATPPEPTIEELKAQVAALTTERNQLRLDKTTLTTERDQARGERDKALLGWRPNNFYDPKGDRPGDPFLTKGWENLTPDTRLPNYPKAFIGTFGGTQGGATPAITFTWTKPSAGNPASYELQLHEGEIGVNPADPSRVFRIPVVGNLVTYKLTLTGHKIRAKQYRFTLVAIDAAGRRSTPAIALVAA
ncbi:cell division protein ZapB [Streptomyces sp. H27-C3]|uniref:cell division protein ZapB n=1 Tax=Streptomyces sp. H27-C3 TaxID=3046305 RepID=UPI0024B96B8D|nr:cell division protein ZapB [Streptomyces sp. H27-C3]MDJ0463111.1 cell division protein ZapB [Streptomyces sp. H27-C3]